MIKLFSIWLLQCAILTSCMSNPALAQTVNPSAPAQAGAGLSQAGSTLSVLYGTTVNTAKEGNAVDSVPQGGTGLTTVPTNYLLFGKGTAAMGTLAPSTTTGQVLTSTGSGTIGWTTPPTASVSSVFGQTGAVPDLSGVVQTSGSSVTSFAAQGTANYPLVSNGTGSAPTWQKLTFSGFASPNNTNQILVSDNGTSQWSYVYPSLIVPSSTTGYILTTNSGGFAPNWEPFPALSGVITSASNTQVTSFSPGGTTGQILTSTGGSTAPTWQTPNGIVAGGTTGQVWTSNGGSTPPSWQALPTTTASAAPNVTGASASFTASSATATIAARYATLVSNAGQGISVPSPSASINLATTGAGGMDTGSAPASGFVALYYIYDVSTSTTALLGVNATSAAAPEIYGGANMPSGYAYSALVAVVPTNSGSTFVHATLSNRQIGLLISTLTTSVPDYTTWHALSISGSVPLNANHIGGEAGMSVTGTNNACFVHVATDSTGANENGYGMATSGTSSGFGTFDIPIAAQTVYYSYLNSTTCATAFIDLTNYQF